MLRWRLIRFERARVNFSKRLIFLRARGSTAEIDRRIRGEIERFLGWINFPAPLPAVAGEENAARSLSLSLSLSLFPSSY